MTQILQLSYDDLEKAIKNCMAQYIEDIKSIPVLEPESDRLNFHEACKFVDLSNSSLRKLCMDRKVPFQKYGRKVFFSRKALQEWREARTFIPLNPEEIMSNTLSRTAVKKIA